MGIGPRATFLTTLAAMAGLSGCVSPPVNRSAGTPLTTVPYVELDRYAGRWYEIARLPNSFEEDCEGVTADYARRADGLITVINTCRQGSAAGDIKTATGRARVVDAQSNARLKVSFFGPFWGDYWIIGLEKDYSLALVGEPSGRYLWMLARTPTIDAAAKSAALSRLTALGYDVTKLYFPEQPPVPDNPITEQ